MVVVLMMIVLGGVAGFSVDWMRYTAYSWGD